MEKKEQVKTVIFVLFCFFDWSLRWVSKGEELQWQQTFYSVKNLKTVKTDTTQKRIFWRICIILATSFCKYISEVDQFIHLLVLIFFQSSILYLVSDVRHSLLQRRGNRWNLKPFLQSLLWNESAVVVEAGGWVGSVVLRSVPQLDWAPSRCPSLRQRNSTFICLIRGAST